MPVPVIAAGVSAIGSLVGGAVASKAAGKAADQQVDSARDALSEVRGSYQPYMNVGQSAITTLGALSGLPVGGGGGPAPMPGLTPTSSAQAVRRPSAQEAAWYAGISGPDGTPRTAQPTQLPSRDIQTQALAQTSSGYAPNTAPMGQGSMVRVQAPDGRIVTMPRNRVHEALQQGGQVLGPATGSGRA